MSRVPFASVALTGALAAPFCAEGQAVAQITVSPGSTRCEQPLAVTIRASLAGSSKTTSVRLFPLT